MADIDRLTPKQQTFINLYNRGMTGTAAAKIAYKTKNNDTAAVIASQNLRKLKVRRELLPLFISNGGIEKSVRAVSEGLNATKFNRFTKSYELDHRIRLKAADRALKLIESSHRNDQGLIP